MPKIRTCHECQNATANPPGVPCRTCLREQTMALAHDIDYIRWAIAHGEDGMILAVHRLMLVAAHAGTDLPGLAIALLEDAGLR